MASWLAGAFSVGNTSSNGRFLPENRCVFVALQGTNLYTYPTFGIEESHLQNYIYIYIKWEGPRQAGKNDK